MFRAYQNFNGQRLGVIAAALALGILTASASANLINNPGFNDNGGGLGEGWGSFGAAGFNDFFGGNPHTSFFSDNIGNFGGVFQTGIGGTAGTLYQFDLLDVRIEENAAADYRFGLEFFQGDDATQISNTLVSIPLSPTGDGLSFSMQATAPVGTVFVRPIIQFDNVTSTASGQENVFVFDTSLTIVPEPTTISLLGLGAVALIRRRR